MIRLNSKEFEQKLVRDYMQNPNPEDAKHLLDLVSAHKTNSLNYQMTEELENYCIDCMQEFATKFNADDSDEEIETKVRQSFGLET